MPSYKYRVLLDNGKLARGKILAYNKSHAIQSLKNENVQQNYTYKSVNELLYKNVLLLSFILFAITFVINKLLLREGF